MSSLTSTDSNTQERIDTNTLFKSVIAVILALSATNATAHGDDEHDHMAALGKPGDPGKVNRTVEITMNEAMRFSPSRVTANRGEIIRFVLKNKGKINHEMVLGTLADLKAHAALMQKFPNMEYTDPNQASIAPGKTSELIWQFTKSGTFDFACLPPGHYEAGMTGKVLVKR